MATQIQNLLNEVLGDAARASKFELDIVLKAPGINMEPTHTSVMAKAASFPGKTHTTIDYKYKGRSIPIKGQTKYSQSWEVTFYLSQDHMLKNNLENWIEGLDQKHNYAFDEDVKDLYYSKNKTQIDGKGSNYTSSIFLYQTDFDNAKSTAQYELKNAFPIAVSDVQFNSESAGTISEFTCTFAYSHYIFTSIPVDDDSNFIDNALAALGDLASAGVDSLISGATGYLEDAYESIGEFATATYETAVDEAKQMVSSVDEMGESIFDDEEDEEDLVQSLNDMDKLDQGLPVDGKDGWVKTGGYEIG
jgi:hypothetical protein